MVRSAWRKMGWGVFLWIVLNFVCNYYVAADTTLAATPPAGTEAFQATEPGLETDTPEADIPIADPADPAQAPPPRDEDQAPEASETEATPPAATPPPMEQSPGSGPVGPATEPGAETGTPEPDTPEADTPGADPADPAQASPPRDKAVEPGLGAETIPGETGLADQQTTAAGQTPSAIDGKPSKLKGFFGNIETAFALTSGMRRDDFRWSIAGNSSGSNPNILSELTWSHVDSRQLTLSNRSFYKRNVYFRGEINYAFIQGGDVRDSDYNENDRGDEFSRSMSEASGDQLWDLSIAGGYPFFFLQERLMVAPLYGLSYHKQNFRITDGQQVITSGTLPPLGPLEGLDSTYRSAWYGPWIGLDVRYYIEGDETKGNLPMELGFSFELHYADYEAEANWNLRSDLKHPVSFKHEDTGYGIVLSGELQFDLTRNWGMILRSSYQYWKTKDGVDRVYNSDGTIDNTHLNEVEWRNFSFMIGAGFQF